MTAKKLTIQLTAIALITQLLMAHDLQRIAVAETSQTAKQQTAEVQWVRDGKVAGKTLDEWSVDSDSENEFVRARAAKTLALFGNDATEKLVAALGDSSDAVVYWAACGLGMLELPSDHDNYKNTIEALTAIESKFAEKPATAMAAAYALCRLERTDGHIEKLIEQVQVTDRATACSAADLLGTIGPDAKAALPALVATHQRHAGRPGGKTAVVDYHIRGACANALRKIDPTWTAPAMEEGK